MTAEEYDETGDDERGDNEVVEPISFEMLSAYRDGELETDPCERVERRLDESARLRDRLAELESNDHLLRQWARDAEPENIARALAGDDDEGVSESTEVSNGGATADDGFDGGDSSKRWSRVGGVVAAAAVVMLIGGAVLLSSAPTDNEPVWDDWIDEMIADAQKYQSGQEEIGLRTDSVDKIDDWFTTAYGLDIDKPDWAPELLIGANQCTLLEQPFAASYLDTGNRFVSVYAIETDRMGVAPDFPEKFPGDCRLHNGVEICGWSDDTWTMVAVADAAEVSLSDELERATISSPSSP